MVLGQQFCRLSLLTLFSSKALAVVKVLAPSEPQVVVPGVLSSAVPPVHC